MLLVFRWMAPHKRVWLQNAELASAAHAEVELVFRSVSHGISDIKVCAREILGPWCWLVLPQTGRFISLPTIRRGQHRSIAKRIVQNTLQGFCYYILCIACIVLIVWYIT